MKIIDRYQSMSVQARAALWFVICSFLQKGISFITVPLFTRLLTAEEYGTYSLYLAWVQVITIFTSLNLYNGVLDNGMSKFEHDRDKFISSMQGLTVTLTTIAFLSFLIASKMWVKAIGLAPVYIFLMFFELYVQPSILFWSGRQRFEYRYKRLVIITLTKSLLNPVLGLIMVTMMRDRCYARILSVVIVEVAFSGILLVLQFFKGKTFYSRKYWKYGLLLAIPLIPHYLAGTVLNLGDRIMIEKMVGASEVAYYSVAYSIGMLVQLFTAAIINAITPWFYGKMKEDTDAGVPKVVNSISLFVAVVSVCLMMVSPELMMIFGSKEYIQGAVVIPPVAASVFFIFLYLIFSLPQFYFEKTQFLFVASIGAAVLNIGLNYVFINLFGYVAAGYTTLACYVVYSAGHYYVSNRVLKQEMNNSLFYDIKVIISISVLLIVIGSCVCLVFDHPIIRYGILLAAGIMLLVKRNIIFDVLSIRKKSN